MFGFWARADGASLRGLCDATFAAPSGNLVIARPPFPWVLITFVRIDRIVSEPPPFAEVGHVTEREVVIWVPTLVFRPPRALPRPLRRLWPVPRHVAAVVPCMWLDNPISIASGREVYGYPKSWGCMESDPPEAIGDAAEQERSAALPGAPARLSLEAFGVERYGKDAEPACRPLLELAAEPGGSAAAADPAPRHGLETLLRESASLLAPSGEVTVSRDPGRIARLRRDTISASLLDDALAGFAVNQVFLKQFRSAERSHEASSQEIVRVPATGIEKFRWARLPPYALTVHDLDSHPLSRRHDERNPAALRLGLQPEQTVGLAFVARFDFRVELGEVMWRHRSLRG